MGTMNELTAGLLRKLLADLERELKENGDDYDNWRAMGESIKEERRKLIQGIEGIKAELKAMEGD